MSSAAQQLSARAVLDAAISEKQFQALVVRHAKLCGWLAYHTWNAKHSAAGFPDLVLIRDGRIIFAELKTEKGKMTAAQRLWMRALAVVMALQGDTPVVCYFLWRPSNWPTIEAVLSGKAVAA